MVSFLYTGLPAQSGRHWTPASGLPGGQLALYLTRGQSRILLSFPLQFTGGSIEVTFTWSGTECAMIPGSGGKPSVLEKRVQK